MANNRIQIKRSITTPITNNTPSINVGELVFSSNGYILAIGDPANSANIISIGGARYPGVLTSNQALVANATSGIDKVIVANLVVTGIWANGGAGSLGQVLHSNGSSVYWDTDDTSNATVSSVNTGNGLIGGPITTTGTISILANTGITANSTGLFVNTTYIGTLAANSANFLNGNSALDLRTYSEQVAATAYSNAVTFSGAADTAYSNAVIYANNAASQAYSNAVNYVGSLPLVNTSQLSSNLSNYAALSGATFTGAVVVSNDFTVTGNLTLSGNTIIVGANNLVVSDAIISLHTPANLAQLTSNDGKNIGLAFHYYDTEDRHALLYRDNSTGRLQYHTDGGNPLTDNNPTGNSFGIIQADSFWAGNNSVYATTNSTIYTGTANNASFLGGIAAASYVNTTQLSTNLANYQTTAGLAANVAMLASNSASFANASITNTFTVGTASYFVANGNVGIGNTTPTEKLRIQGTASISGNVTVSGIATFNSNVIFGSSSFSANGSFGTPGQVLASGGSSNVYWSKVSATSVSNTQPVSPSNGDLWWDTDLATMFIYYDDGSSAQWVESTPQIWIEGPASTYTLTGNAVVSSDLTVQGTLFETSDIKSKEQIETISSALEIINSLRGVSFNWKRSKEKSSGVVAQEIEQVLPFLVKEDLHGNKSVNYLGIIGFLIEAIKELDKKVSK